MPTELDFKVDLLNKVSGLSAQDTQKLSIFLSGLEAGKALQLATTPVKDRECLNAGEKPIMRHEAGRA